MISPGKTIGLLGGGQLGRMFCIAARRMGYRVHTFEPSPDCPAGQVSDLEINAPYTDEAALAKFAEGVDVITFEFENIPTPALERLSRIRPVHPRAEALHICQNREREKLFLRQNGYPHAPFEVITSAGELEQALKKIGTPSVLKTADFGYDGKGQLKLTGEVDAAAVWQKFNSPRAVLESWVSHDCELSIICARGADGQAQTFPVSENIHTDHILDFSIVPARISGSIQAEARKLALDIAARLEMVGLIAVELFCTRERKLLVNELAPRPHNSGHYTFDACVTSQFEQQLRAVCGLPLGSPELLRPVVMVNLLGDLWKNGEPRWMELLAEPSAKLHLYGKAEAKPGRKMGHFCVLDEDRDTALKKAETLKKLLAGA
jgi:5-(carboxyamino)imidazole ribonucleotide synthase